MKAPAGSPATKRCCGCETPSSRPEAGAPKQHINIVLGELETAGYLHRVIEGTDQRLRVVYLTERGMELAAAVKEAVESVEARWREVFGELRVAQLKMSLQQLREIAAPSGEGLSR